MAIGTSLGTVYNSVMEMHGARYGYTTGDHNVVKPDDTADNNVKTPNDVKTERDLNDAEQSVVGIPIAYKNTQVLTPEDLQRAGLSYRDVDDRTNEDIMDQISANVSALKQWGHNLIHPDPDPPIPDGGQMAKDLGFDSIKADPTPDRMRDLKLMYDNVVNDAIYTGKIFTGMYHGLVDKPDLSQEDLTK